YANVPLQVTTRSRNFTGFHPVTGFPQVCFLPLFCGADGEDLLSSTVQAPTQLRAARFFSLVKEAIFGSRQDFTAISIDRAILLLAVPMVLEMAMESLFGIVDIFWVAHLGADATATVGITEGILLIVMSVAIGLSMGTTAVVARRTGERDPDGA